MANVVLLRRKNLGCALREAPLGLVMEALGKPEFTMINLGHRLKHLVRDLPTGLVTLVNTFLSGTKPTGEVISARSAGKRAKPARGIRVILILAFVAAFARQPTVAQPAPAVAAAGTNAAPSPFARTIPNTDRPPGPASEGMVWIPGGEFSMGCAVPNDSLCSAATMNAVNDSQPIHRVYVDGFWMDKTDVTNEKFEKFVNATGVQDRRGDRADEGAVSHRAT